MDHHRASRALSPRRRQQDEHVPRAPAALSIQCRLNTHNVDNDNDNDNARHFSTADEPLTCAP